MPESISTFSNFNLLIFIRIRILFVVVVPSTTMAPVQCKVCVFRERQVVVCFHDVLRPMRFSESFKVCAD